MTTKRRPNRGTARYPSLNRRTFNFLVSGFDWDILDPDPSRVGGPDLTEAELLTVWREHGATLLAWARGEIRLPGVESGHKCRYTRHLYPNCHPQCKHQPRRTLWGLEHFGDPGSA
jgi:hypothetical protein